MSTDDPRTIDLKRLRELEGKAEEYARSPGDGDPKYALKEAMGLISSKLLEALADMKSRLVREVDICPCDDHRRCPECIARWELISRFGDSK